MLTLLKRFYSWLQNDLNPDKIDKRLTTISSVLIRAGVFLAASVIIIGMMDKRHVIQPFSVPADFADQGYSGVVISNAILDKVGELININIIKQKRNLTESEQEIVDETTDKHLEGIFEMEVPGVGMNLSSVINTLKQAFGMKRNIISGELTKIDSILFLNIRISGQPTIKYEEIIDKQKGLRAAYDSLIVKAAEHTLKNTNPVKYLYYAYDAHLYDKATDMANVILTENVDGKNSAYNVLGLIANKKKDYDTAMRFFNLAIKEKPDYSIAYNNMGICLKKQKRYQEAQKAYQKATEVDPNDAAAFYNWGLTFVAQDKFKEAIEKYRSAIELKPSVTYYNSWAKALKELKDYQGAKKIYWKSLSLDAYSPKTYNNIAALYLRENKMDSSLYYAKLSLNLDSTYEYAYSTMAENYSIIKNDSLYYRNIELALKYNYPTKALLKNEYHQKHFNEVQFQKLAAKYNLDLKRSL